jgi:uncharacterized membrane protein
MRTVCSALHSSNRMPQKRKPHELAGVRVAVGSVVGIVVLLGSLQAGAAWDVAVSGAWSTGALLILLWVWLDIAPKDAAATAEHAQSEDLSRTAADATLLAASVATLVAVAYTLIDAAGHTGQTKALLITLALVSVALAWATVHTVYTLRYADLYYAPPGGGVDFNEQDPPDYHDFAYLALTIGMTYQVSDTDLQTKPVRRTAVRHALLSFLFGSVILAITINVVASLLK